MSFISDFDPLSSKHPLTSATRFDPYFDAYELSLAAAGDQERQRTISLIAKSPASAVAQALAINLQRFKAGSVRVSVILAQISPAESLAFLMQSLRAVSMPEAEISVRWAKNRAFLDAHERLTLGRALCWTGDAMRRSEDSRSAIDRVDDENPLMLREAVASFEAIWNASAPLPKVLVESTLAKTLPRPEGLAREPYTPELAADIFSHPLDEYLGSRRH